MSESYWLTYQWGCKCCIYTEVKKIPIAAESLDSKVFLTCRLECPRCERRLLLWGWISERRVYLWNRRLSVLSWVRFGCLKGDYWLVWLKSYARRLMPLWSVCCRRYVYLFGFVVEEERWVRCEPTVCCLANNIAELHPINLNYKPTKKLLSPFLLTSLKCSIFS